MLTEPNKKLNNSILLTIYFLFSSLFTSLVGVGQIASSELPKPDFFSSTLPLNVEIKVNFDVLNEPKTPFNEYRQAFLSYSNDDNKVAKLKIKVKRRSSSRDSLKCVFPLLMLNFPKEKVLATPFAGLDKVHLVTPCQANDSCCSDQVLLEYACYKAYEYLTAFSFKVRLLNVTLSDSANQQQSLHFKAFIIQDDESLAQRHGAKILKIGNLQLSFADRPSLNTFSMFQYLIGNTQWSITNLYNLKLLSLAGRSLIPIPFEFSQSGIVNAQLAKPAPYLHITDVRSRQFLGLKMPNNEFLEVKQLFNNAKQQIISEFENLELHSNAQKRQAINYIHTFFNELEENPGIFVE
jgi:hypothetical protein